MENHKINSVQEIVPGLSIIHSNHLEDLRKVAAGWIKAHPLKVLETEQFIVQSNGMAQWLKLALADDDGCGISAGLEVHLPGRYVWTAYRSVLGNDSIPVDSPYDRDRLVWRFFRLLPLLSEEEAFLPLNRFLEHDEDQRKQYQLACHLADLYDQYQVYRADWLEDWSKGKDRLKTGRGEPVELPLEHKWQAQLWRRLKNDIPTQFQEIGRADLHQRFLRQIAQMDHRPDTLPPRVMVFGISSLPQQVLETLHAVSRLCQVLLFVHNPCRHFWADIIEDRDLLRIEHARHRSKDSMPDPLDPELLHQHANPLLAAWGKQGRDYIGLLYGYDEPDTYQQQFAQIDLFDDFIAQGTNGSLLQQVQQAILDLVPLPGEKEDKQQVTEDDLSISFQLAHSRQREVEILQDQLLHCFETIECLNPRDVIVMTPDIEAYAPHIEAVFGNLAFHDSRFIPFTIADKPGRESVPLLKALEKLLHLPDSRMAVSDIMDLLEVPAFRNRFGVKEADLPKLHQWIKGAGISWGLNPDQRTGFGLPPGLEQNTWEFGLKRMLLGYAVGKAQEWNGIEPYDEVGGLEAALIGPLAAVIEQMESLWKILSRPGSPEQWCLRIRSLAKNCFLPEESRDRLILNRLDEVLDNWLDACTQAELDRELTLAVVRDFFLGMIIQSSISQRFLAGMVNFGTLMPMRAIPFKVVCLLGMNDKEFPRSHPPLDFDLMAQKGLYRPGDRSRREDDRYLFLEALLSAREKFYISYVGRDVRDNSPRMPSVLVGQLRDYISAGWSLEDCGDDDNEKNTLIDQLTCIHPLQPFGSAYFLKTQPRLFTYAHEWRSSLEVKESGIIEDSLEKTLFDEILNLGSLIRFVKNPVKYFFNQSLSIYFDQIRVVSQDQEPFVLDALAPFGLGNQLLEAGLSADPAQMQTAVLKEAERLTRTGELPMAGFGLLAAQQLSEPVMLMLKHHQTLLSKWPLKCDPMEISIPLDPERSLLTALDDWLDRLYQTDSPDALPRFGRWEFYPKSILDKKGNVLRIYCLIPLWIRHVSGCAQGINLASFLVAPDGIASLDPLEPAKAMEILMTLIEQFWTGLTRPLAVTARTGIAYVDALMTKDAQTAKSKALKTYEGDGFQSQGELGYDPYLQRAFPDFDALWQARDNSFERLCQTLYKPLVNAVRKEA
ncbi:exodeoxyribonuclease V subunit gamma [Desulfobacula toluolica]|uniref:RecC: exodeoxyribonuclease V, gamma subunit n=1 Tax=Desulfobacula toluolica (strain DSM 7467 / Tol2) TaxID=651182 RepID=K0NL93_DESTT|nr:exodeoxyribonuclease V subunit gamma [Desulfobacula toluolica]CCK82346.1 RecC: exodeoxyribonuclease V, gamma subunit [Desulfobacula toluolica Tol2]